MKDKTKKIALGAAIAGAVGYVAGILTAPKSGKETRKDIEKTTTKAWSETEKTLKSAHSELNDLLEKAKKEAGPLKDKAKKGLDEAVVAAVAAQKKAREVLSLAHEGATDDKELDKVVKDVTKAIDDLKTYLTKNQKPSK
ncbi:hypothetical protein A3D14_01150 [Candidatus Saccharibacteria bacterium RIFCSPHIGHO2_02_FULL_47_12]|nr:MAG: hypothetical protein A3D14_01150 [Candidatus Saccharibacteria bacterium RIFCSPHIGHO2_02_FULL_47_12]